MELDHVELPENTKNYFSDMQVPKKIPILTPISPKDVCINSIGHRSISFHSSEQFK